MTRDRLLEQAIELLAIADFHSVTLKEERNQVVREGIELLRQPKHTEPTCPECKAKVLYECVACSSNNYPPQQEKALQTLHAENERLGLYRDAYGQPEQEPVAWGVFESNLHDMFFTQEEAQEMARLKGGHAEVKPLYTHPPQRTEQEPVAWEQFYDPKRVQDMLQDVLTMGSAWSRGGERIDPMSVYKGFEPEARPKPPWSQKTIEQKIEASISHYKKEIERAKEVGDPHQFVGTYEGFVVCLESILEKNT
jgi:hypothetical protein